MDNPIIMVIVRALKSYREHHGDAAAGSLTLTTIIAVVPACIIALTIISNLPGIANYQHQILDVLLSQFIPNNIENIKLYLTQFIEDTSSLSTLQLILLIVSTMLLIHGVNQSINQIFNTKRERHGVAVFSVYLGILLFGPILLSASLVMSLYAAKLPLISMLVDLVGNFEPMSALIPFLVAWLSLFSMYYFVPSEQVKWISAFVGSLFAAVMIEITKLGFGIYVSNVKTYEVLYGTLSAIPLFLIWIYLAWSIVLFGASLSSSIGEQYKE